MTTLELAADLALPNDQNPYVNLGAEWRAMPGVTLRGGYRGNPDQGMGYTVGIGLMVQGVQIDYAFVPYEKLGSSHRFSVGLTM
jgi:hypothetical protein